VIKFHRTEGGGVKWSIYVYSEDDGPAWLSNNVFQNREMAIQDVLMLYSQLQIILATSIRESIESEKEKEK